MYTIVSTLPDQLSARATINDLLVYVRMGQV